MSMSIEGAIRALRAEICARETTIAELERLTRAGNSEREPGLRRRGAGKAAAEILREAGKPMHGVTEILPALRARGYSASQSGIATVLMRTLIIKRVAPGIFAYAG